MKKVAFLCLILVLAMGTMGVGLAHWAGVLNITGTVSTATFGAELSQPDTCTDNEGTAEKPQDIGQCSCSLSSDNQTITVTITDGYPCYSCNCTFDVHCTGTMPIKIKALTPVTVPASWLTVNVGDDPAKGNNTVGDCGANGDVLVGEKIHFCECAWGLITCHVEQTAPTTGASTTFTYTIDYEQAQ